MTEPVRPTVESLNERATLRSMRVRSSHGGFQLESPWRVVVTGTLDNLDAYLTAAEERDVQSAAPSAVGFSADF